MEIPFLKAVFPRDLPAALTDVLGGDYVGAGDTVTRFEQELENYLDCEGILATSSCTAALTLAYAASGLGSSSIVLSTPMTCAAANIPLLQLGATIHWLDIDPLSGNVTPEEVARQLDAHPEAGAVVIMDWGGAPCDYPRIAMQCRNHGTPLILDAAQSFGASCLGRLYPGDVDYICYSFGPTKLFSSIEGGAIGIRDRTALERLKSLRWYGIRREQRDPVQFWDYRVEELGYRFTTNNVFAQVGLHMLSHVEARLRTHRALAAIYDDQLANVPGLRKTSRLADCSPNFWLYTVLVEERENLMAKLHSHGVHAAIPHRRNDRLLAAWNGNSSDEELAGVDRFDQTYLCLPIGPWVTAEAVQRICELIFAGW